MLSASLSSLSPTQYDFYVLNWTKLYLCSNKRGVNSTQHVTKQLKQAWPTFPSVMQCIVVSCAPIWHVSLPQRQLHRWQLQTVEEDQQSLEPSWIWCCCQCSGFVQNRRSSSKSERAYSSISPSLQRLRWGRRWKKQEGSIWCLLAKTRWWPPWEGKREGQTLAEGRTHSPPLDICWINLTWKRKHKQTIN